MVELERVETWLDLLVYMYASVLKNAFCLNHSFFFQSLDEDTVEYPMGVRQSATIIFSDNDDDVGDEKGRRKKRRKKGKVS